MFRIAACILGVLCSSSFVAAQPEAGQGMAVVPRNAPPAPAPLTAEIRAATRAAYNKLLNPAGKLDLSNPEATVRSFVWSFYQGDVKTARECLQYARPLEELGEVEKLLRKDQFAGPHYDEIRVLLTDVHSYIVGDSAMVTLRLVQIFDPRLTFAVGVENLNPTGNIIGSCERLRLKKVDDKWLIAEKDKLMDTSTAWPGQVLLQDLLPQMISLLTNPEQLTVQASISQCQSHLKQVALGVMQFIQDWDEKFSLNADWKKQLMPYVQNEAIFRCPEHKEDSESFSFNSELKNKSLLQIDETTQTIMIYEGKDKKFYFRHENGTKTNIAFVDGHVKAYTREILEEALELGNVRWAP